MKVAISQPTYLPWLGYFDLIDQVDAFVLLDTVQFEKRSWQQRNRIKTPRGLQWLTIPVISSGRFTQTIEEVEISDPRSLRDHIRSIELNYGRTRYFDDYVKDLRSQLTCCTGAKLLDLNARLIGWLMDVLEIKTKLLRASQFNQQGKRTELLANLCTAIGAYQYISPPSSAGYLLAEKEELFGKNIDLFFHNYEHPEYNQLFPPFCPQASVLDLVFNEGPQSLEVIRKGRRALISVSEMLMLQAAGGQAS